MLERTFVDVIFANYILLKVFSLFKTYHLWDSLKIGRIIPKINLPKYLKQIFKLQYHNSFAKLYIHDSEKFNWLRIIEYF